MVLPNCARQWDVVLPQDLFGGFAAWVKTAALSTKWPDRCKTLLKYAKRNMLVAHDLRRWHADLSEAFKMSVITLPEWLCGPGVAPSDSHGFGCPFQKFARSYQCGRSEGDGFHFFVHGALASRGEGGRLPARCTSPPSFPDAAASHQSRFQYQHYANKLMVTGDTAVRVGGVVRTLCLLGHRSVC